MLNQPAGWSSLALPHKTRPQPSCLHIGVVVEHDVRLGQGNPERWDTGLQAVVGQVNEGQVGEQRPGRREISCQACRERKAGRHEKQGSSLSGQAVGCGCGCTR